MNNLSKQAKIIIGLLLTITILLVIIAIVQFFSFRIVKSTPDTNNYPSSMGVLVLEFNKELDSKFIYDSYNKEATNVIQFSFDSPAYIEVSGKTLKITIQQTAKPGNYSLQLKNIRSQSGSILQAKIPFVVKNIPYGQLDEATKLLFDEYATEGETPPQDPIINVLPYQTDKYKISYTFPAEDVELPATITITMKFFAPGDAALPATPTEYQAYLNDIRTYRTAALDYLKSKNIDINKYIIKYTETDLQNEFPAGYITQPEIGQ